MLSFYSHPIASQQVKVFRFTEDTRSDSGFKGYNASVLNIYCFIKRMSAKEAFKQGIENTGKDIREMAYLNTYTQLYPVIRDNYADIVKWDSVYWEVMNVLKNTEMSIFYECHLSLITDVPQSVLDLESA